MSDITSVDYQLPEINGVCGRLPDGRLTTIVLDEKEGLIVTIQGVGPDHVLRLGKEGTYNIAMMLSEWLINGKYA